MHKAKCSDMYFLKSVCQYSLPCIQRRTVFELILFILLLNLSTDPFKVFTISAKHSFGRRALFSILLHVYIYFTACMLTTRIVFWIFRCQRDPTGQGTRTDSPSVGTVLRPNGMRCFHGQIRQDCDGARGLGCPQCHWHSRPTSRRQVQQFNIIQTPCRVLHSCSLPS